MLTASKKLTLKAETAYEMMSVDPVSIRDNARYHEALAFFIDRNITAAPVIDATGRPVGVVSVTDLLVHTRESSWGSTGFTPAEEVDPTTVAEMMTPTIFTVKRDTPAEEVVRDMIGSNVHHLFVVDHDETVIGVISTRDILRKLK